MTVDRGAPLVRSVETAVVERSLLPDLVVRGGRGVHASSAFVLVRVVCDDGTEGFGEVSATPAWSGEDAATATHLIRAYMRDILVGQPIRPLSRLAALMDRAVARNPFTKAGVNTALVDANARSLGVAMADLLGGAAAREVPVKISMSGNDKSLEKAVALAQHMGFRAFKVKVGLEPEEDVARVRLLRRLVGPDAHVGVDANGGWSKNDAAACIRALAECRLAYVEQPVHEDDLAGLNGLRRIGPLVVADESVYGARDVVRVAAEGAADVVSIYVGKSGGPVQAADNARLAQALGLGVVIGSNGEMGIGAAAQIHLACAVGHSGPLPHDIQGDLLYGEATTDTPLRIEGSTARLPDGAGLGVRPDAALLRTFG